MADNAVPTLVPKTEAHDILSSLPSPVASLASEKKALFDSIVDEKITAPGDGDVSSLKTVFTGLLWFGYAAAIVVALMLVWSAARGLLLPLAR